MSGLEIGVPPTVVAGGGVAAKSAEQGRPLAFGEHPPQLFSKAAAGDSTGRTGPAGGSEQAALLEGTVLWRAVPEEDGERSHYPPACRPR